MKRNSKRDEAERRQYLALYLTDVMRERFEGRSLKSIREDELSEIIEQTLHNMPSDDDFDWARRQGKKLGVGAAELLAMRWSQANALAIKKGMSWAIKPKRLQRRPAQP